MFKTHLHDVFYTYLMLYHGVEFMYVRMQLAFSYTVVLCLPSMKQETVTFNMSVRPSIHRCSSKTHTDI